MKKQIRLWQLFFLTSALAVAVATLSYWHRESSRFNELKSKFIVAENGEHLGIAPNGLISESDMNLLFHFGERIIELDLTGKDLRHFPNDFLSKFRSIEVLTLSHAKFELSSLAYLDQLPKLSTLKIQNLNITDQVVEVNLSKLDQLKHLYIGENSVSIKGLSYLSTLKNLKELEATNCDLNDEQLKQLKQLSDEKGVVLTIY